MMATRQQRQEPGSSVRACGHMAGVAGAACVASACVALACVAAAGEHRKCQRCASASAGRAWGSAAAAVCGRRRAVAAADGAAAGEAVAG